jgi:hypothetical protein
MRRASLSACMCGGGWLSSETVSAAEQNHLEARPAAREAGFLVEGRMGHPNAASLASAELFERVPCAASELLRIGLESRERAHSSSLAGR